MNDLSYRKEYDKETDTETQVHWSTRKHSTHSPIVSRMSSTVRNSDDLSLNGGDDLAIFVPVSLI